jgi:chromate reductase, NAD(P)H dehydrogenase (quinone)
MKARYDMAELTILGISGSLRADSYNTAALRAARELLPAGAEMDVFDRLSEVPLYNQDMEKDPPPAVVDLKRRIERADAILIATPEYNFSVPGVLKNAIDWASRPSNSWAGKPAAIIGASTGMLGTARAQYHLRQMFVFLDVHPVNKPEVLIPMARDRFDDQGNLTDEASRKFLAQLMENLVAWTERVGSPARETVGVR